MEVTNSVYTVPKAFSMHEKFPKLLGNIEDVEFSK
jgi:hypothetical protein